MEQPSNLAFISFFLHRNTPILHSSSTPIEIFLGKPIHLEQRVKGRSTSKTRKGRFPEFDFRLAPRN